MADAIVAHWSFLEDDGRLERRRLAVAQAEIAYHVNAAILRRLSALDQRIDSLTADLKRLDTGDFRQAWGGVASLQLLLPATWTAARDRRHTLEDLARWLAHRPPALAALGERKGKIAPGFDADLVICASSGTAGLEAVLAAIASGKTIALANKEVLVMAGELVTNAARQHGVAILPVDSEHNAIHQCLHGRSHVEIRRLILTASGGPFRNHPLEGLDRVGPVEALRHPTWQMGKKITIDSATLMNKGLEVIEAHHLFDVPYDKIEVVVHPQSVVHSMVEFVDGSLKGHLGYPDMRIPIQYALTTPERLPGPARPFTLTGLQLSFEKPDREVFPALDLAFEAGRRGGSSPSVLNAADEVAVRAFLEERLDFLGIAEVVEKVLDQVEWRPISTVEDVEEADREARRVAAAIIDGVWSTGPVSVP